MSACAQVWGRRGRGARVLATFGAPRQLVVLLCRKYYAFGDTNMPDTSSKPANSPEPAKTERVVTPVLPAQGKEQDARPAPDPTRYGDWEKNGRCIDF
ncbi:succinate dehydrogenase assembly factor 4 [Dyella sp. 2HG41-7]|uniref:DUF1674 domain-containing protein n=1 Tax=Dyella sp. 2HG41-7 TaxID=2883239 RepID=UPI0031F2FBAD